jgi:HEAT repeat protein
LVALGAPAVEPLVVALKAPDSIVRENAADALGEIKDPRAVEPLIAALKDSVPLVRDFALDALSAFGTPAVEPLIAALKDSDSVVRENIAVALRQLKDPRAVESLIAALKDSDSHVRQNAVDALGAIGAPAIEPLIATLKECSDSVVRYNAVEALSRIEDPHGVPTLLAAFPAMLECRDRSSKWHHIFDTSSKGWRKTIFYPGIRGNMLIPVPRCSALQEETRLTSKSTHKVGR